jgi:hypothetical protein
MLNPVGQRLPPTAWVQPMYQLGMPVPENTMPLVPQMLPDHVVQHAFQQALPVPPLWTAPAGPPPMDRPSLLPPDVMQFLGAATPQQRETYMDALLEKTRREQELAEARPPPSMPRLDLPMTSTEPMSFLQTAGPVPMAAAFSTATPMAAASLAAPPRPQHEPEAPANKEDGKAFPTHRAASNAASRPATSKAKSDLKITGANVPFATLGLTRSHDPVFNMAFTIHARLVTHTNGRRWHLCCEDGSHWIIAHVSGQLGGWQCCKAPR